MAAGSFTKLFSSITASTIWCEPNHVRIVWITMLAMANRNGEVAASIPGLAGIARVSVEDCRDAITRFLAPDRDSRTKSFEGRRIEEIEGGWKLLNYLYYREIQDAETVKESKRRWWNENRGKLDTPRTTRSHLIQAEAEAEAEAEADKSKAKSTTTAVNASRLPPAKVDFDWSSYKFLNVKPEDQERWQEAYPAISVPDEIDRAAAWLHANPSNRKSNYTRFLINWFSRSQDKAGRVK